MSFSSLIFKTFNAKGRFLEKQIWDFKMFEIDGDVIINKYRMEVNE